MSLSSSCYKNVKVTIQVKAICIIYINIFALRKLLTRYKLLKDSEIKCLKLLHTEIFLHSTSTYWKFDGNLNFSEYMPGSKTLTNIRFETHLAVRNYLPHKALFH